jgi:hypothetical protein
MMANITSKECKGVWGSSDKGRDMSDGMTRSIEHVEAPITKVVPGFEVPNLLVFERRFHNFSPFKVSFMEWGCFIGWPARKKFVSETRTDNEFHRLGKDGWCSRVIEMPMREHESLNFV